MDCHPHALHCGHADRLTVAALARVTRCARPTCRLRSGSRGTARRSGPTGTSAPVRALAPSHASALPLPAPRHTPARRYEAAPGRNAALDCTMPRACAITQAPLPQPSLTYDAATPLPAPRHTQSVSTSRPRHKPLQPVLNTDRAHHNQASSSTRTPATRAPRPPPSTTSRTRTSPGAPRTPRWNGSCLRASASRSRNGRRPTRPSRRRARPADGVRRQRSRWLWRIRRARSVLQRRRYSTMQGSEI